MARPDDPHDLPLDPSEWERTELYREDDPALVAALAQARAPSVEGEPVDVSDVTVAPPRPRRWRGALWVCAALALGIGALVLVDELASPTTAPQTDAPATTPDDLPADYNAAFRHNEPAVQRCLNDHAADAGDTERVTLHLDLDLDGRVEHARLEPAALAEAELGACLLAVARGARFAPQAQPVAIRIPIALHRR